MLDGIFRPTWQSFTGKQWLSFHTRPFPDLETVQCGGHIKEDDNTMRQISALLNASTRADFLAIEPHVIKAWFWTGRPH